MAAIIRMELLKLAKRPMTWVLAILLHGGIGFGITVSFLQLGSVEAEIRDNMLRDLTLPGVIPWSSGLIAVFGAIMLSILAASSIGSEYGWGTLRPFLATGMPRGHFLASKMLALAAVGLAFVVLPMLLAALLAVPIARLNDRPAIAATVDLAWFLDLLAIVGRCYLAVLVPAAIAFLVGLAGRSQAAGIGTALGLLIGEQIVSSLLLSLGLDWARQVVNSLPMYTSFNLINYNTFGPPDLPPGIVGEWRALATLAAYGLACIVAGFAIFRRRDIRGTA
jgi:ABC-2 type transport system permease protein